MNNTSIILDAHPEWIALRDRAISTARANMEKPKESWRRQLTCMPGQGTIWQWDSCFMALYAGYTPEDLNGLGNIDNLYPLQREDGYYGMAYNIEREESLWGERVNPPLYAWAEWLYAERTGDTSRLSRVYPHITKFFFWLKANRRRENGLYWFEDTGSSGMDNSPRSGYSAYNLHGSDVCFVDLSCQQVLSARCLAKIATVLGKADEAAQFEAEADELAALIDNLMWSDRTNFYHDVFVSTNNKLANKTIAAFWTVISGVAKGDHLKKLIAHLTNPATFGARHPVPSLSRDDPNFNPAGGYWLGSVWPPTNYMIAKGLRAIGERALARDIVSRHLTCMTELLGTADYDSIWECYSPDFAAPATCSGGTDKKVRADFVGWSGLGPFVMLAEDILGLDICALEKRITWNLAEKGPQGICDLPFNGGAVDLMLNVADDYSFTGSVKTDRPFALTVITPSGTIRKFDVRPGSMRI